MQKFRSERNSWGSLKKMMSGVSVSKKVSKLKMLDFNPSIFHVRNLKRVEEVEACSGGQFEDDAAEAVGAPGDAVEDDCDKEEVTGTDETKAEYASTKSVDLSELISLNYLVHIHQQRLLIQLGHHEQKKLELEVTHLAIQLLQFESRKICC